MLDHEKLRVYQHAIRFFGIALSVSGKLPRGNGPLVDELRRAAISVALNIAEGTGPRERTARRDREHP